MSGSLLTSLLAAILAIPIVDTKFAQVAPVTNVAPFVRTDDEERAVVLIQGLYPHPFSDSNVSEAMWQNWQEPDSDLVQALGRDSDVYSFAYAQHVPVDQVCQAARLTEKIDRLRQEGYSDIVLVGHSAGGLIARQFVEDNPDAGVTKVVQVCSPNGGSMLGHAQISVRRSQEVFLTSLTESSRAEWHSERGEKRIPEHVQFVCLVGHQECRFDVDLSCRFFSFRPSADIRGDWIVSSCNQWTSDLQQQGIPVVAVKTCHLWVVQQERGIKEIRRLVREDQPRWTPARVNAARRLVLGAD
jgi:pimeloyl-ACP methyl ester carboxylesterase